jgi:hypothetical protein
MKNINVDNEGIIIAAALSSVAGILGGMISYGEIVTILAKTVTIGIGGAATIGTGVGVVIFGAYHFIWSKEDNSQEIVDYYEK